MRYATVGVRAIAVASPTVRTLDPDHPWLRGVLFKGRRAGPPSIERLNRDSGALHSNPSVLLSCLTKVTDRGAGPEPARRFGAFLGREKTLVALSYHGAHGTKVVVVRPFA